MDFPGCVYSVCSLFNLEGSKVSGATVGDILAIMKYSKSPNCFTWIEKMGNDICFLNIYFMILIIRKLPI